MGAITLVAMIITVLVSMNYKSIQSLKIAQMMNQSRSIDKLKITNNEEKEYTTAVNQFCGKNSIDGCMTGINSDNTINKNLINQYKPTTMDNIGGAILFENSIIDQQSKSIIFVHKLKDSIEIEKYVKNAPNQVKAVECLSTGTLPQCTNNEIKVTVPLSKNNILQNISSEYALLTAKIDSGTLVGQPLALTNQRKNTLITANTNTLNAKTDTDLMNNVVLFLKSSGTKDYATLSKLY